MRHTASLLGLVLSIAGCAPDFDDRPYLLRHPRLIALIADPPEVRPGAEVSLTPILAGGAQGPVEVFYRFCSTVAPLADPRPVAADCLTDSGAVLDTTENAAHGVVPSDACVRFGPDPKTGDLRARDADDTGGYYQPIVVRAFGESSTLLLRVACPMPDVPVELARELTAEYRFNQNPELFPIEAWNETSSAFEVASSLRAGHRNRLRLRWASEARERYLWLAPGARALSARREALSISWFTSEGVFAEATTGVAEASSDDFTTNWLTLDDTQDQVEVWAVAHDSRGGAAALNIVLSR